MDSKRKILITYSLKGIMVGIVMIFLLANIVASQLVPSLYFDVVREDRSAVLTLLKTFKLRPEFPTLADIHRSIFGPTIGEELFAEERGRDARIVELESLLQHNPKSRDVLYALALLYEEQGNPEKAAEYMGQAREVDPTVGMDQK